MTIHLIPELDRFVELRRRLLATFPDLDDQTLADTLEGATNLKEALAALIRSTLEDECMAKALKERIDVMRARLTRLEARAGNKRLIALDAMQSAEMRKLVEPDFTASLRVSPLSVFILSENELPIGFLVPQPPKPDKRAILEALTQGALVPGAVLGQSKPSISIRSQ
jgi:hypothetical protein